MLSWGLTKEHLHSSSFSSWLSLQKILSPLPQTALQVCTDWLKWDRGPFHWLSLVAAWLLVLEFLFLINFLLLFAASACCFLHCGDLFQSFCSLRANVDFLLPFVFSLEPLYISNFWDPLVLKWYFFPPSLFPNPWGDSWDFGELLLKVWDAISTVVSYKQPKPSLLFTLILRVCVCEHQGVCVRKRPTDPLVDVTIVYSFVWSPWGVR